MLTRSPVPSQSCRADMQEADASDGMYGALDDMPVPRSFSYEVWGSDQSNSVAGVEAAGVNGSFMWIWDNYSIELQLAGGPPARAVGCSADASVGGPCDLQDVFPGTLVEVDGAGQPTGAKLADLDNFGRLHGMLPDPLGKYVAGAIFAPGGGYVGIIDATTKEAVALFRATGTNVGNSTDVRSVHMPFWATDGSHVIVANLNGKLLERVDVDRNSHGTITKATFNRGATLGVGKNMTVTAEATAFIGKNAHGNTLVSAVAGEYDAEALSDLTPNGVCKENGCSSGADGAAGGRSNNVIICPIPSSGGRSYITMGGGGLLVADSFATPMVLVGEYGDEVVNGAGCGGAETGEANGGSHDGATIWLNAGVSAAEGGATWSTYTMYTFDDRVFEAGGMPENEPAPKEVYADGDNTATGGRLVGDAGNDSGQLPGVTTRRDAHGTAVTVNGDYVHTVDRLQNLVEVFDAVTQTRIATYDLTSSDGQGGGGLGPCQDASVTDDALPPNDPTPDLLERTPDGRFLMIAFRGPSPVSVAHSGQGSCPGVGVVELLDGGRSGKLVAVLRSSNTVADSTVSAPGGFPYMGAERSDVHAATVVYQP